MDDAYSQWARLEREAGQQIIRPVGMLVRTYTYVAHFLRIQLFYSSVFSMPSLMLVLRTRRLDPLHHQDLL